VDPRSFAVVDTALLDQQAELVELRHQYGQALAVLEAILAPWEGVPEHPQHTGGFHGLFDAHGQDCELCAAWSHARTQYQILLARRRRMGKAFPLSMMGDEQITKLSD
jgi:hypothetical protein